MTTNQKIVKDIWKAELGFLSFCASQAWHLNQETQFLRHLHEQLTDIEQCARRKLGDELSDRILNVFQKKTNNNAITNLSCKE
jgi:hypothetical protein